MRKFREGLRHTGEWFLVVVFLASSLDTAASPVLEGGPIAQIFGGEVALWIYTIAFAAVALCLAASKIWRKKRLHKHSLLAMYLLTLWTTILTMSLVGYNSEFWLSAIDDIIIGAIAAACWLAWKFKTEYVSRRQFRHAQHLRT